MPVADTLPFSLNILIFSSKRRVGVENKDRIRILAFKKYCSKKKGHRMKKDTVTTKCLVCFSIELPETDLGNRHEI